MPVYEYRCQVCETTFEVLRPHTDADVPAPCPDGHAVSVRLLSLVASRPRGGDGGSLPMAGGGCCGGGCCAH